MQKFILTLLLVCSFSANALTVKLATLVPKGTNWARTIKHMTKEIKKKTDGKVKFRIYYGGVQGDEPDVLVAMNPAALKANLHALKKGGVVILNIDSFDEKNIQKAEFSILFSS